MVIAMLGLFADLSGQTVGNLLDPILWIIMVAAALRVRMRYVLPVAALVALLLEAALWAMEPPELQAYRFAAYTLIGRTLAGWLIGSGARLVITRRRQSRLAAAPVEIAPHH